MKKVAKSIEIYKVFRKVYETNPKDIQSIKRYLNILKSQRSNT